MKKVKNLTDREKAYIETFHRCANLYQNAADHTMNPRERDEDSIRAGIFRACANVIEYNLTGKKFPEE